MPPLTNDVEIDLKKEDLSGARGTRTRHEEPHLEVPESQDATQAQ
jgi:hypothetical protein